MFWKFSYIVIIFEYDLSAQIFLWKGWNYLMGFVCSYHECLNVFEGFDSPMRIYGAFGLLWMVGWNYEFNVSDLLYVRILWS